jgi:hypothetical protein
LATSLARSSNVAVSADATLAEAGDLVGTLGDHAHRDRLAAGRGVGGVDSERGERRVDRGLKRHYQVRLPLITTRGRVQIRRGFDCT